MSRDISRCLCACLAFVTSHTESSMDEEERKARKIIAVLAKKYQVCLNHKYLADHEVYFLHSIYTVLEFYFAFMGE